MALAPRAWLRQLLSHVVRSLLPLFAKPWAGAVRVDEAGSVVEALYDPDGRHIQTLTAVTEEGGRLFFGNLGGDYVSVIDV